MDRHSEQQSPGNSLVTDLQQLGISTTDIERIVTDLFLAAADTVRLFIKKKKKKKN